MKEIIIAVDGYSATGKSTTAKQVAQELGYIFIDTGAMYRAVALYFLDNGVDFSQESPALHAALDQIEVDFVLDPESGQRNILLNGVDVEARIRGMEINEVVSDVARLSSVRAKLVALQQAMGERGGVVMDGRDIGTVVFPQAELKLFLTAQMDIRVQRRMAELTRKGKPATPDQVRSNLAERDRIDSTREDSPLRKAEDAIEIDTSFLKIPEQVRIVVAKAQEIISRRKGVSDFSS